MTAGAGILRGVLARCWPADAGEGLTAAAGNSVVLHWTGTAWKQEPTPAASNLFRVAVLPNNQLFASDHGTIFLVGQVSG